MKHDLQKLNIQSGDALVLQSKRYMNAKEMANTRETLEDFMRGAGIKGQVLILNNGMQLKRVVLESKTGSTIRVVSADVEKEGPNLWQKFVQGLAEGLGITVIALMLFFVLVWFRT